MEKQIGVPGRTGIKAHTAYQESYATSYATAFAAACKDERARVRAILKHDEAKDRRALAMSIAMETELSLAEAIKLLAAAPRQKNAGTLATLMAGIGNPKVGVDPDGDAGPAKRTIDAEPIFASRRGPAGNWGGDHD